MKSHLKFSLELLTSAYDASDETVSKLKQEYSMDNYIERIIPILDEQFSIEEMQEAIRFYSSEIGKKMFDPSFLSKLGNVESKMDQEISQKLALNNE